MGSLEIFLQQETGVDQDAVLAYLSDGRRLTNNNIRELAGAQDQVRSVFWPYHRTDHHQVHLCFQQTLSRLQPR